MQNITYPKYYLLESTIDPWSRLVAILLLLSMYSKAKLTNMDLLSLTSQVPGNMAFKFVRFFRKMGKYGNYVRWINPFHRKTIKTLWFYWNGTFSWSTTVKTIKFLWFYCSEFAPFRTDYSAPPSNAFWAIWLARKTIKTLWFYEPHTFGVKAVPHFTSESCHVIK